MKRSCMLLSIYAALFIGACTSRSGNKNASESFPVTSPIIVDTVYTVEYVADIHSRQNIEIRARVKGHLEQIHVDEGKPVKKGQLLFSISSQQFRQDLLKARAAFSSALAEAKAADVQYQNTKILVEKNVVGKSELEMAQARLDAANAKILEAKSDEDNAQLSLSFTEIKSPFDGILNRIPNKTGSLIDDGTLLTTISDNKDVFAYFRVSEKDYLDFIQKKNSDMNKQIELVLANHQLYPYKGIIETVEGEFDKTSGNIAFRARFPNPDMVLKHGSSGKVRLRYELKQAMIVPQRSTFEIQDKTFVYVIDSNNIVQLRSIVPKLRLPLFYVIDSGLKPSDIILYEGIQRVKEGDIIIPKPVLTNNDVRTQTKTGSH